MLALVTNATSAVLHRKLTRTTSQASSRGVRAALSLLLQTGSAAVLVSAGFVVPLPFLFGEWQEAAQFALSLLWIVAAIGAVNFLTRPGHVATTHHAQPRMLHHRIGRRTGRTMRVAG